MTKKSLFRCPVCHCGLHYQEKSLRCENSHSYDIAREGYVNLLLANQKGSSEPGDSREMLLSRRAFLNSGFYSALAQSLTHQVADYIELLQSDITILDAGCGEGYYTDCLTANLIISSRAKISGIDISKEGIKLAAKRNKNIQWGVAGVHTIPLHDESVDIIINVFAPHDADEFSRILKEDGIVISATPGPEHLLELKRFLYDTITLHDDGPPYIEGLSMTNIENLKYKFSIYDQKIKTDLLRMTPYFWRTKPERIISFEKISEPLATTADFRITIYRKER